ncbi:exocyst complex component Sec3-domain-containing protein [Xylariales sp. AK1849]|nr:exocyst complex component Sec3-domain-containing protein [Xylariales sp. AK1849]
MDAPRQNGGSSFSSNGREMSRAERFEEEKRRIVDSCFNKKDTDGSLLETYITHIKIREFSSHPSTPPPPEAVSSQSEKPRVIIVAVRKSGRVRMHKSKENANGTFSIGKTWDLNDLTAIESFTSTTAEPRKRQYAGDVGFVVIIGKPYYWQAQADKEKKFFIASLIKIYGKYTGGKLPDLIGFDPREMDQVLGSRRPPGRTLPAEALPSREPSTTPSNLSISATPIQAYQAPPPRPPTSPGRGLALPNGKPVSPASSMDSSRAPNQSPALRRLAGNNASQDSFATYKSDDANSIPPRSRGGMNGPGAFGRVADRDTTETPPPPQPSQSQPPLPPQVDLPDRKRPPMDPARSQGSIVDRDLVPAPLMSPGFRREPQPPPRSNSRMSPRKESVGQKSEPASLADSLRETEKPPATPEPSMPSPTPPVNGTSFFSAVSSPAPIEGPTEPPPEPEESRPGLGPMIKSKKSKGDLAGALWKAASAAAVFKPRPGGAGERLREMQRSNSDGPEGMTEVVPAPPRLTPKPETPVPIDPPKSPRSTSGVPEVKVTVPNSSRPNSLQSSIHENRKSGESVRKKTDSERDAAVTGNDNKYLTTLGVDTSLLAGQTGEFTKWLDHFGWVPGDQMRNRNFEEMKMDVDRQLNKAQAGGWVVRFEEEDERIDAIKGGLDLAITECDELENLLTLYSVELSTLSDDIAYIEAQGQGLQVQAANQKLLKKELESLLDTCAIQREDLRPLEMAPLDSLAGLEEVENTLVTLYKAMMKIDPTMDGIERRSEDASLGDQQSGFNTDYGKMRIVQEKKEMYLTSSAQFLQRFREFMDRQFDQAAREVKQALDGALSKKVDPRHHDVGRDILWRYSPLMVYARDLDLTGWNTCLQLYQDKNHPLYKSEFKEVLTAWKRNARKPTGEEADLLFSAQVEKQQESTMATARKLTVKRSQTLARSLRSPLGEGGRNMDKSSEGRSLPYEIFAGIVDDLLPLVEIEQNFIVDFFHATTLETSDFPDAVLAAKPRDRRGGDLRRHRLMEPDRELARRMTRAMEAIFAFLEQDLQMTVDWVLSQDPLQGVGVLAVMERKHSEMAQSNQDFLNNILQKIHGNLESRFTKFVDEQIRAIEDTKVKIKKRKGVISFMRVFPQFSSAIENMMATAEASSSARRSIDREYDRIIKSMFESLKVIARENPATLTNSGADPEDKEALNFHILLIENMNHFLEEVDTHGLEILEDWKEAANSEMTEHMTLYLSAVMRRPLGKLLEYLENIEAQLASGKLPSTIAAQPSNSKGTFNKVLSGYDGREVRKGVEALRKRVEKHFGDVDEEGGKGNVASGRALVNRMLKECERFYGEVEVRISTVTSTVYGGDVLFEWPRGEVKGAFAGGR